MQDSITLYELNSMVRSCIEQSLAGEYWVQAELSDVRSNSSGHCYLELLQKDIRSSQLIARARGMIWSSTFKLLKPYFEQSTGQPFTSGIKVMVKVAVQFHELYGHSLVIHDIDPAFTIGDLAVRRREILRQLEEEGVLTLNKELQLPPIPNRIAVISSATAAGYGDFCSQLESNTGNFRFTVELFQAFMQGNQLEQSVLSALDRIYQRSSEFDVVVIIRGGGATSDLSGFDSYLLAASCAQFPLPLITGIGHERDDTVIDAVAHTRVKTPTAAAELLISCMQEQASHIEELAEAMTYGIRSRLEKEQQRLDIARIHIPARIRQRMQTEQSRIDRIKMQLPTLCTRITTRRQTQLEFLQQKLQQNSRLRLTGESHRLQLLQQKIQDASPDKILARGYAIVWSEGKAVRQADQLKPGNGIEIKLHSGALSARVEHIQKKQKHS